MYNVGDIVWVAQFNPRKGVNVPCPVCYTKKVVTLILGNDDRVELPCSFCKSGYEAPSGYVTDYQADNAPMHIIIDGMETNKTKSGTKIKYWVGADNCHTIHHEENIFDTKEAAFEAGKIMMEEWQTEQQARADWIKHDKNKSYAWNAGYHMRLVKKYEKDILYHKDMAKLCKDKKKGGE